jgi:hypothetical protein
MPMTKYFVGNEKLQQFKIKFILFKIVGNEKVNHNYNNLK